MLALICCLAAQLPASTQPSEPTNFPNVQELTHNEFGSVLTDDRIFTMELVVTTPESNFKSGATVRTVCRDLSGQVCWERVAQGFTDFVKAELLPDRLVYIEDQNLLIQTTALQSAAPIYSANVQALDADTGDIVWSASLNDDPNASGIFGLKFDAKRNQVLAFIDDYGPFGPGVAAINAATGAVNWEAAFSPSSFYRPYIWSWDFAPDHDLLFAGFGVGPVCCVPWDIKLYTVNLNDGSSQFNSSLTQEEALTMDIAASPDGQGYALALGRAPFAQILYVDGPSEQLLWRTSVPQSTEWEQPSVTFEPDGSSILAGYSRRGLVNSPTQTPAARFLRIDAGSGQIQWVDTDEGPQGTFSGNARGPHFIEVNDTDHLRSFTRYLALDKHVQVRQRVRNSDGAILATDVADAGGPGALHWQELGVDPGGTAWSLVQVPLPGRQPSFFFPSVALAHWPADLSGAYAFEFLALDGLVNEFLDSSSGSPSGELSAAVMRWEQTELRVAVVEVATGQQRLSVKLPGGAQAQNHVIRFSEDEQTLAVRGQGVAYEQIPPNDLTVLSAQDGTILWERELPTPLSTPLPTALYPNAGQASMAVLGASVISTSTDWGIGSLVESSDLQSGALQWSATVGGYGVNPYPLAADPSGVYVAQVDPSGTQDVRLLRLAPQSGGVLGQHSLGVGSAVHAIATNGTQIAVAFRLNSGADRVEVLDLALQGVQGSADLDFSGGNPALVALAPNDGFAAIDDVSYRQVGDLLQPFESSSGSNWVRQESLADPGPLDFAQYFATDGGSTLMGLGLNPFSDIVVGVAVDTETGETLWIDEDLPLAGNPIIDTGLMTLYPHSTPGNAFGLWSHFPTAEDLLETGAPTLTQFRTYELPDVVVSPDSLSLASGGSADLWIRGEAQGDDPSQPIYFLVAASELVDPGTSIGAVELPFSLDDPFVAYSLSPFQTLFTGLVGNLDHLGNARAQLDLPPGLPSELAGATFYFAWVQFEVNSVSGVLEATFASDPAVLTLVE